MLVVDASALVELLVKEGPVPVEREIVTHRYDLHAPAVVDLEVLSAVRRLRLPGTRGAEAVADLLDLPLARYQHEPLLARVWELRDSFSSYDAAYVALAEALPAPLLTVDAKLARAVRRQTDIEVLLPR